MSSIDCEATVTVGSGDAAVETTFDFSKSQKTISPDRVGDLTLCWRDDSGEWEMGLRAGCASGQTDLDTATTSGLPAISSDGSSNKNQGGGSSAAGPADSGS